MLKEITNFEVDALNNIIASFPESSRAGFLESYANRYTMTSYFIEKFRKYITPRIFSQALGLTEKLINLYTGLFTAEEYEKHPGNIEILFSIDIIKKYNINLDIVFNNYKSIKSELSEHLLNSNIGFEKSILKVSTSEFLSRKETIKKYHEYYVLDAILKLKRISPEYFDLVCSGKIIPADMLCFLITNVLSFIEDYDYKKLLDSIIIDEEGVDVELLGSALFDTFFALSVANKKLLTQLATQMNKQLSSLFLNDLIDILTSYEASNEDVLNAIDILSKPKEAVKKEPVKATVMANSNSITVDEDDLLW